jgi:hypothetical protein
MNEDARLRYDEKIELIKSIEYWQGERWKRLKKFHSIDCIDMKTRHYFMQQVINLIREQKERLIKLKQSINN